MKGIMMDYTKHANYLHHDPHISKKLPKMMRPLSKKVSKLLEGIDFTEISCHDPHMSKAMKINSTHLLLKLLREHDNAIYLLEAEAKTIPTKDFVSHFAKFCDKNLPKELANVTFDQLYRDGAMDYVAKSTVNASDDGQEVSSMVCIALPTYAKDKDTANKLVRDFTDVAMADGYFLSSFDAIECKWHDKLPYAVTVIYLTFEAKYTELGVDLESNLFHVTIKSNLKHIAQDGLLPKSESHDFAYPPRIFLFNKAEYDLILSYGNDKAHKSNENAFYVIRIEKNALENSPMYKDGKIILYRDPAFSLDDTKTDQTAIFTYDKIPLALLNENVAKYEVGSNTPTIMKLSDFKKGAH